MYFKIVFVLLVLATVVSAFREISFFERETGDELIYIQTKVSIPTSTNDFHYLQFTWSSNTHRFTDVVFQMNGVSNFSVLLIDKNGVLYYWNFFFSIAVFTS